MNKPSKPPEKCDHVWQVYSIGIQKISLGVECQKCSSKGMIDNLTMEEWDSAFDMDIENPDIWTEKDRVIISEEPETN